MLAIFQRFSTKVLQQEFREQWVIYGISTRVLKKDTGKHPESEDSGASAVSTVEMQ